MDVLHTSVRHIADVVGQRAVAGNLQQAVLEALVGEVERILGIHDAHPVDDEAIGVHVGSDGGLGIPFVTQRDGPCAVGTTGHLFPPGKLDIHQDALGILVLVLESHRAVGIGTWLCAGSDYTAEQQH